MAASAPFAMKALPFIAKGAASLGAALFGKKLSGPSKEQKAGMQGAQQATDVLSSYSRPLMSTGMQFARQGDRSLGQATDYYSGILGGDRSKIMAHMSPEIGGVLDAYRGSERSIGRNLRGGSRDYALAELSRQKAGQVAGLIPQARRNAAEAMGDLGQTYLAGGTTFTGQGVNTAANAAGAANQLYGMASHLQDQQAEGGRTMGSFIYDILQGGGGGSGGGAPLRNTIYNSVPQLIQQNRPSAGGGGGGGSPTARMLPTSTLPSSGLGIRDPRTSSQQWSDLFSGRRSDGYPWLMH